ncbi:MAG TPA: transcriptional regulator [Mycobacteriales bacterium]|nr:transcriptional regulator [Mycobacteriales bacterium]
MGRVLKSPKWWGLTLLVIAGISACALLGRWQWDKALYGSGDLVNLGYGLQWWTFAAVVLYGWGRAVREVARPRARPGPDGKVGEPSLPRTLVVANRRPVPPADAEEDAELAAYNRYLARLHASTRA